MKKLFLAFAIMLVFVIGFAFTASAESVHNENTVDYNATVTLDDGTELPLYDENKEALIWYISGTENGKNIYSSLLTVSSGVKWTAESWDEVRSWGVALENGTSIDRKKIVVLNLMDDDVVRNTGNNSYIGKPVDSFKQLFDSMTALEYCYLRLDTRTINTNSFNNCPKLKYINLEDLTQLSGMAQSYHFSGCTSLFAGQVLDLTKTKLTRFESESTFSKVPIKGIRLPKTFTRMGSNYAFKNCTELETVTISNKVTVMGANTFDGCTSLRAIFYIGTEAELNASPIVNLAIEATNISYTKYKALSETEKANNLYVVYDYDSCLYDAPNEHEEVVVANACVADCKACDGIILNHTEKENLTVVFDYESYSVVGKKTTSCNNEGCTHQNVVTEAPAIFVALGYSVKEDGSALMGGYSINSKALIEYNNYADTPISYGIIMTNSQPTGNRVVIENGVLKSDCGIQLSANDTSYARLNYTITGFETKEQSEINFIITLYVNDENGISFIQIDTKTSTADISVDSNDVILNTITHKTVAEATIANLTEEMNNETDAQEKQRLQAIINNLNMFVKE